MPRFLDVEAWGRRDHFHFFKDFDNPFFNVTAPVDVTGLYRLSREPGGPSFFLASLWLSIQAANEIEPFRYRLRGERVLVHEVIHPSSTVLRDDETFTFAYFRADGDFPAFERRGRELLDRLQRGDAPLEPAAERDDLIHYSVLPWIDFTSFSHARRWGGQDSVPKIVFGKHTARGAARTMPVSVEVHHALMDGLHVGRFFERFAELLADLHL